MKQSERLMLDAGQQMSLIEGYRREIDLRAGQIDRAQREIDDYNNQITKTQMKYDQIIGQAQQEREKEEDAEHKQHQQMAIIAAQNLNDRQ